MKIVITMILRFLFATFSQTSQTGVDASLETGLDGKISTAFNLSFSQSNLWIY